MIELHEKFVMKSYVHKKSDYHAIVPDDKIFCSVCDNGDFTEKNFIIICFNCQLAVHSKCYNIRFIPEAEWLCDYCRINAKSPKDETCFLCPVKGGALKLFHNKWAHLTCAKYLQTKIVKDKDVNINNIDEKKFKLKCFSCNLKIGACIQCNHGRCATAFHVECRKDLIIKNKKTVNWYCPVHNESRITRILKEIDNATYEFILGISDILWKNNHQSPELEKFKRENKEICGKTRKKRILMNINKDFLVFSIFCDSKLMKTRRYVNEKFINKGKKEDSNDLEKDSQRIKLENLPLKQKRSKKSSQIVILSTEKGELTINMKIPGYLLEDSRKKQKNSQEH